MPQMLSFPFGKGLHQENDERMQEPGNPRSIFNLIRKKNGRLETRLDYDAIANTVFDDTGLELFDLHTLGDQLVGFGDSKLAIAPIEPARAANVVSKVYSLVERASANWVKNEPGWLSLATQVRQVGNLQTVPDGISSCDIAAGNGLVCAVYECTVSAVVVGVFHIFDPVTGASIKKGVLAGVKPRVVFTTTFIVSTLSTAGTSVLLEVYSFATNSFAASTTVVPVGAAIVNYDFAAAFERTSAWIAVARADTTTVLRGLSSAGATTFSAAGPAVLADAICIIASSLVGATQRVHVAIVRDATLNLDLYSYAPPTAAPYASTTDILTPLNFVAVGMCMLQLPTTTELLLMGQDDVGGMRWRPINATTHALGGGLTNQREGTRMATRPLSHSGRVFVGVTMTEGATTSTHFLTQLSPQTELTMQPSACLSRLLAKSINQLYLPAIGDDASTGLSYWTKVSDRGQSTIQSDVSEVKLCSTDRRQTAEIGGLMYIAGGVVSVNDSVSAVEAGGFMVRPVISTLASAATGGALVPGAIYQAACKYEILDNFGNRLQSAPSEVAEATIGVGHNGLVLTPDSHGPFSYRNYGSENGLAIPEALRGNILQQVYRTEDTSGGRITFHFEAQKTNTAAYKGGPIVFNTLGISDTDLSDNEIIYTQGARGELSGPLEFVTPDPCSTIASSADKILTGGLPGETRIQESRPLFTAEQVQWSDSIGFYRDVKARVLAVARLDERRILFTDSELFECDGPGLDDNGLGDLGAPRKLPSDVGIYGGVLGWRSVVEISAGILFQGLRTQIYLLPRGGVTPAPVGFAVEEILDQYPDISSATYLNEDQTVRFTCNNDAGTESVVLLFNVRFSEWFVEGPYAFGIRASAIHQNRLVLLTSANQVLRQRTAHPPAAFIAQYWQSGTIHPFKPGMFGRVYAIWFVGGFRGNCRLRATIEWDDGTTEASDWFDIVDLEDDQEVVKRFEFDQLKCENCKVTFETSAFQSQATAGLTFNYFSIEIDPSSAPRQLGPEDMT
jgi:hypothetical protein